MLNWGTPGAFDSDNFFCGLSFSAENIHLKKSRYALTTAQRLSVFVFSKNWTAAALSIAIRNGSHHAFTCHGELRQHMMRLFRKLR